MTQVASIPTVGGSYQPYNSNPLAKEVFFYNSGTFKLELTVTDGSGATAKCQTSNLNVYY